MNEMLDAKALSELSAEQRRQLLRDLVELERRSQPDPGHNWRWDALLVLIVGSCIVLAAWTGYLAVTLPHFYRAGNWRGAWVGFDLALLVTFAATGWAAWRRRQLLIIALIVLATLLICDAWFDVVLDVRTPGFMTSVLSAILVELPMALLAIAMARRLLRLTISQVMRYEGLSGSVPRLRRVPLFGPSVDTPLRRLVRARAEVRAGRRAARSSSQAGAAARSGEHPRDT